MRTTSAQLPGFSAESSVYTPTGTYRGYSRRETGGGATAVLAFSWPGGPKPDCDPTCLCRSRAGVTPRGCPCCASIEPGTVARFSRTPTTLDCEPGSEAVCDEWCAQQGGGMSSNPDGSTTCTIY